MPRWKYQDGEEEESSLTEDAWNGIIVQVSQNITFKSTIAVAE